MQNDQTYSDIINSITTKDDINLLADQLDLIGKSIYELNGNLDLSLKDSLPANLYSLIAKLLQTEKKEDIIKKMKELLAKIELVDLTLSIKPTQKTLDALSSWFAKSIPQKTALDIKVDQRILGGALIAYKGKYFDGSLKNVLESVIKNYV